MHSVRLFLAFLRKPSGDRSLLAHAFVLHAAIALAHRVVRFGVLSTMLTKWYPRPLTVTEDLDVESRAIWAVQRTAALSPFGNTCLTRALATQCLLRDGRRDAELRFGVRREGSLLAAHAWLEWNLSELPLMPADAPYTPLG